MFKIGDFSQLCRVPVSALRYYAGIGLLEPAHIDQFTGYRYYSLEQLPRLYRILALKDLGIALDQIAHLLHDDLSIEQIRGMLRLRQAEIQQHLSEEQERLRRVEARLQALEMEGLMPAYEVVLKQVEPQLVASIRETVASYQDGGPLFNELYEYLGRYGAGGLAVAIYHDDGYKERDVDTEAVAFLQKPVPASERVKVYELPAATVASVVHHGAYQRLNEAYDALLRWIESNGYTIVSANRELYLHCPEPVRTDNDSYVTEIQFPVAKG